MGPWIVRVYIQTFFRCVITADHWLGQAVRVVNIIEPKATFYAKAIFIRWSLDTLNTNDFFVFNFERELATNTAIWANRLHLAIKVCAVTHLIVIKHIGFHQRTCWAGLNAFAAGNTGR